MFLGPGLGPRRLIIFYYPGGRPFIVFRVFDLFVALFAARRKAGPPPKQRSFRRFHCHLVLARGEVFGGPRGRPSVHFWVICFRPFSKLVFVNICGRVFGFRGRLYYCPYFRLWRSFLSSILHSLPHVLGLFKLFASALTLSVFIFNLARFRPHLREMYYGVMDSLCSLDCGAGCAFFRKFPCQGLCSLAHVCLFRPPGVPGGSEGFDVSMSFPRFNFYSF